jgi:hypothetical protein
MSPLFGYIMCLVTYLGVMAVALALCVLLFIPPATRPTALRLCLAIIMALPGMLLMQFIGGLAVGAVLACAYVLGTAFHEPVWLGVSFVLITLTIFTAATLLGWYTGARIGWDIGGGKPLATAIGDRKIVRFVLARLPRHHA